MPEHIFDSIERPGLFIDQMHMNGPGSAEFSRIWRNKSVTRRCSFNTTQFFVFLAIVLALFYAAPRALRRVILLVASYFFYLSLNYNSSCCCWAYGGGLRSRHRH